MEPFLFCLRFLIGAAVLLVPGILTAALLKGRREGARRSGTAPGSAATEHTAHQALTAIGWGAGSETAALFLMLFLSIVAIDQLSSYLRRHFVGAENFS